MASLATLKYIKPQQLKSWIDSGRLQFAVVDVRDDDFQGGHIANCKHYPSVTFERSIPKLIEELKHTDIKDVVFHCALSQARGPSCALKFTRSLPQTQESFNIYVLKGGFSDWQSLYGTDPTVTVDYDEIYWKYY